MAEAKNGSSLVVLESDCEYDYFCQSCIGDGYNREAEGFCTECDEYLCDGCCKYHKRLNLTRHHIILDKTSMPRGKLPSKVKDVCTDLCLVHKGKLAESYCHDHDVFCCTVCAINTHKQCDAIEYIPDVSSNDKNKTEYKDFEMKLQTIADQTKDILKLAKENISKSKCYHSELVKSIRKYREEINSCLDKLEKDITVKADVLMAEDIKQMNSVSRKYEDVLKQAEQLTSDFQKLASNEQHCRMFTSMKKMKHEVQELEESLIAALSEIEIHNYKFQPDNQVIELLKMSKQIGKLCVNDPVTKTATYLTDIICTSEHEYLECYITGSVMMTDNMLVCTDFNNYKVKVIDTVEEKVTSELALPTGPWDITKVSQMEIAVTLPTDQKVLCLKLNDGLSIQREIKVTGECKGIAYADGKFVISYVEEKKLEIIDSQGTVLQTISEDNTGNKLFSSPNHVAVNPSCDIIFVSDYINDSVISLSMTGTVKAVYEDKKLSSPENLQLDTAGRVYVCAQDSITVHILTPDCIELQILLTEKDGLVRPYSLSYCEQTEKLYIGSKICSKIKVYHVS